MNQNTFNNTNSKKALVTGAAGFIGSFLCAALVSRGYKVFALDLQKDNWWRHDELAINCEKISVNLSDFVKLEKIIKNQQFDCVFHLASYVNVERKIEIIDHVISNDIMSAQNIFRACQNKTKRFVVVGTCEEYGNGLVPFNENQREIPVSPYSWAKVCITHLGQLYSRIFNMPIVMVRPFLTYGPMQVNNMLVPATIRSALENKNISMTKGEQTREFNYVTDTVEALMCAGFEPDIEGEIFNLGCGIETTIVDIVTKIYKLCQSKGVPSIGDIPYRNGETMHFFGATEKARNLLKYKPAISLDDGLKESVEWYKKYLGVK